MTESTRRHDLSDSVWALLEAHLPASYGDWKNTHRRFCRWRDRGVWEALLEQLIDDPDFEWLMIDASHCKVHSHAAGARGGNQGMSRTKGAQHQGTSGRGCAWYAGQNQLLQKLPVRIAPKLRDSLSTSRPNT